MSEECLASYYTKIYDTPYDSMIDRVSKRYMVPKRRLLGLSKEEYDEQMGYETTDEFLESDRWFMYREKDYFRMQRIIKFFPIDKKTRTIDIHVLAPRFCIRFKRHMERLGYYPMTLNREDGPIYV